jgi:hypothetical protein
LGLKIKEKGEGPVASNVGKFFSNFEPPERKASNKDIIDCGVRFFQPVCKWDLGGRESCKFVDVEASNEIFEDEFVGEVRIDKTMTVKVASANNGIGWKEFED